MEVITPSNIGPWQGYYPTGSKYSELQLEVMKRERPSWTRFADHIVELKLKPDQPWEEPGAKLITCPIIAWSRDKSRVLIIAPAGDKLWMDAAMRRS